MLARHSESRCLELLNGRKVASRCQPLYDQKKRKEVWGQRTANSPKMPKAGGGEGGGSATRIEREASNFQKGW